MNKSKSSLDTKSNCNSSGGSSSASSSMDLKISDKRRKDPSNHHGSTAPSRSFLHCLGRRLGRHFPQHQHQHQHHHQHQSKSQSHQQQQKHSRQNMLIVYNSEEDVHSSSTDSFSLSYERCSTHTPNCQMTGSSIDLTGEERSSGTSSAASAYSRFSSTIFSNDNAEIWSKQHAKRQFFLENMYRRPVSALGQFITHEYSNNSEGNQNDNEDDNDNGDDDDDGDGDSNGDSDGDGNDNDNHNDDDGNDNNGDADVEGGDKNDNDEYDRVADNKRQNVDNEIFKTQNINQNKTKTKTKAKAKNNTKNNCKNSKQTHQQKTKIIEISSTSSNSFLHSNSNSKRSCSDTPPSRSRSISPCSLTKGLHLSRISITSSVCRMFQHFTTSSSTTTSTRSLSCSSTPLRSSSSSSNSTTTKQQNTIRSKKSSNSKHKATQSTSASNSQKKEKKQKSILRPPVHYVYMKGMSGLYSRVPRYTVCCPYTMHQTA